MGVEKFVTRAGEIFLLLFQYVTQNLEKTVFHYGSFVWRLERPIAFISVCDWAPSKLPKKQFAIFFKIGFLIYFENFPESPFDNTAF